jgi:hypothetical protein
VGSIRFRTNNNRSYDLDLEIRVVAQGPEPNQDFELPGTKRSGRFDLGKQTYNYSYTPDAALGAMSGILGM